MLTRADTYDDVCQRMRWRIPAIYNMGVDVCDTHADARPEAPALVVVEADGQTRSYSFTELRRLANRLANAFGALGLMPGDRIGVLIPQSLETALGHVAAWRAGLVSIPLFPLFGPDALAYRLADSGAKLVVTDTAGLATLEAIRDRTPDLRHVLAVGAGRDGTLHRDFWATTEKASDRFRPLRTRADDPAVIIYTSGTTGHPKGALHAHRVLLSHTPAVEFFNEFFPQPGDRMWTPADWAWIGGLMNVLMASWHHGVPVVAHRAQKFDPEGAIGLMAAHGVRNVFLPPTALRMIRQTGLPRGGRQIGLRTLTSAGEPMGADLLGWCREAFGVTPNEYYGQTECNLVVANCAAIMPVKPGSMGRPVPGHQVAVIDDAGAPLPSGQVGEIAVRRPDPVMMLGYWRRPEATAAKFVGEWLRTGDLGRIDADGYVWFVGRADDVITSAGYRIGPGEIEDCLGKHPAVAMAAVVGVPDPVRTEVVKAFIQLAPGREAGPELADEIRGFVRERLAAHEYPRLIEFVDALPLTATGKVRRNILRERAL